MQSYVRRFLQNIRATNRTFGKEETLTEEVYYYDKDNHSFGMVNL